MQTTKEMSNANYIKQPQWTHILKEGKQFLL